MTAPYLQGEDKYTRFGFKVVTVDINHDEYDDLVVSAPTYGEFESLDIEEYYCKDYYGKIYIYLGGPSGIGSTPNYEIMSNSED